MQMRRGQRRAVGAASAVAALALFATLVAMDPDSEGVVFAFGLVISTLMATAWQMLGLPWLWGSPFERRKGE